MGMDVIQPDPQRLSSLAYLWFAHGPTEVYLGSG